MYLYFSIRTWSHIATHDVVLVVLILLGVVVVVVNAKPARAVALLLGDHDSSHASTDPPGGFRCPSGPDRSISLVVGPDDVSTGLVSWGELFKKVKASNVSNGIGIQFGTIVLQPNRHQLMESDFQINVILSRWRPWPSNQELLQ